MSEVIPPDGLGDEELRRILSEARRIAVVGFSRDPSKPSHFVPKFLIRQGYDVIPVNPNVESVLGLKSYKSLLEIEAPIDIVDVFRPSSDIPPIARQALSMKPRPRVFWMQEGIYSREAAEMLRENGVIVVWNRCIMKEHNRLFGSKPLIPIGRLK
ncbi:MAG: CoA-binding protein, partial [Conexivisphaerales archaeon]